MRIAIYSRKSVATGRGESIENQCELCRALALARWPEAEVRVFEDEGWSGRSLDRPQLRAMLAEQRVHPFDAVVCYRLDRISRSVSDFSTLLEELHAAGTAFLSVREQFDTSSPMGRAMLYIASVFAQLERETIAERVRDNMRGLAKSGRWLGGAPPLGYRAVPIEDTRGRRVVYLTAEEEALAAVRSVFLAAAAGHTAAECTQMLTAKGFPLSPAAVRELLENPVYCAADETAIAHFADAVLCFDGCDPSRGLAPYGRRSAEQPLILALGQHAPAVSGEEWLAAQKPPAKRAPHTGLGLLAGLVVCGRCGRGMTVKRRSNDRTRFDYLCGGRRAGTDCGCPALCGRQADAAARQALLECGAERELSRLLSRRRLEQADARFQWMDSFAAVFDDLSVSEQRKWVETAIHAAVWDGEVLRLGTPAEK